MANNLDIAFDNSFEREMEGFFVPVSGEKAPQPQIILLNAELAEELGLNIGKLNSKEGAAMLSGSEMPTNSASISMAYAGHQFGGFSPQLGDGRALLVGELIDGKGQRKDLQLKGSGRTPFSRGGDGKAGLGPVLREYLMGEAMHGLGIPTTRALAATTTGEMIFRERLETGAVLARVASSHIRVGTFQFFASRGQTEKVRQLADYAIKRHYSELSEREDKYIELFRQVRDRQAKLIAKWVLAGFVHGVMNTDNMTISGETIDYGPCAFMDYYDPNTVFSSIDEQGRYAYGNQPAIAQWNLARLAECLIELVCPDDRDGAVRLLTDEVTAFPAIYQNEWLDGVRAKLGWMTCRDEDLSLANSLHEAMNGQNVDFTSLFRELANVVRGDETGAKNLFDDPEKKFAEWLKVFAERGSHEDGDAGARAAAMDCTNPLYIPRNHKVEEALAAADEGDMDPFNMLLARVSRPYDQADNSEKYAEPAPDGFGKYITFCGT